MEIEGISMDEDFKKTKRSLRTISKEQKLIGKSAVRVLDKPINLFYGITSTITIVILGLWFANIAIIQSVFSSSSLSYIDKFDFIFSMPGSLLGKMDLFQIVLISIFAVLWLCVSAFWLESLQLINERHRLKNTFLPSLFVTLCIGAVGIISISLVTPVLTFQGVSVYVSEHFSGTLLLIAVVVAAVILTHRFATLLHRSSW